MIVRCFLFVVCVIVVCCLLFVGCALCAVRCMLLFVVRGCVEDVFVVIVVVCCLVFGV